MEGNRFDTAPNDEEKFSPRKFLQNSRAIADAVKEAAVDLKSMVKEAMGREELGFLDKKDPVYALVKDHCDQYRQYYDFETGEYNLPEYVSDWTIWHLPRIFFRSGGQVTESQANWLIDTLHTKDPDDPRLQNLRPTKRQMKA